MIEDKVWTNHFGVPDDSCVEMRKIIQQIMSFPTCPLTDSMVGRRQC